MKINPTLNGKYRLNGNGKADRRKPSVPLGVATSKLLESMTEEEPKDIGELADRMDEDYQVSFASKILIAHLKSVPVTVSIGEDVQPADEPRVAALADLVQSLWYSSLESMSESISKGRVAYEKVWAFDPTRLLTYIRKFEPLPFEQTTQQRDANGHFTGIKVESNKKSKRKKLNGRTEEVADSITLTEDKSWWLAIDATALEPHGRSRYLGAVRKEWEQRCEIFKLRDIFLKKFMLRGGIAHGPEDGEDEDGTKFSYPDQLTLALKALQTGGLLYIPGERDENGDYPITFTETPNLQDPSPVDAVIDKSDIRILRGFGISELSVQQTGDLGSFAMAVVHRLVLMSVVQSILQQWVDSFQKYVINKCVEQNFEGPSHSLSDMLVITYPDLTAVPDSLMQEIAKAIVSAPTLSPVSTALDIEQILDAAGIPIAPDFQDRLQAALRAQAQMRPISDPAAQPPGGNGSVPGPLRSGVGLANPSDNPDGLLGAGDSLPELPDWETITEAGLQQISALWEQLFDALQDRRVISPTVLELLRDIQLAEADIRQAARLLGMASLWKPSVAMQPGGIAMASGPPLRPGEPLVQYPWMTSVLRFLANKNILTREEYRRLSSQDKRDTITVKNISDNSILRRIRDAIKESVKRGETPEQFRERVKTVAALPRAESETLLRTNSKQGYIEGKQQALSEPAVANAFPYDMLTDTNDDRVRDEHRAVSNFVVRRGTPEHRVLLRLVSDFNCRCDLIPLTEARAQERGINTYGDLPVAVLRLYG